MTLLDIKPISAFAGESSNEFMYQVFWPIFGWMLLIVTLFLVLVKKYTFGKWTKDNPNPYNDETLGLPRGFFRGIITMTLMYVVVILELVTVYTKDFEFQFSEFMVSFQMMIAFYFGSKVMHHITATDRAKTTIIAESGKNVITPSDVTPTNTDAVNTETAQGTGEFTNKDENAAG